MEGCPADANATENARIAESQQGTNESNGVAPITIAIAGGGITGICLALGILNHAKHIHVHVYEAAGQSQEVGAGVAFGVNAQKTLSLLDPRAGEAYARIADTNADSSKVQSGDDESAWHKQTYIRIGMGMDHAHDGNFKAGEEICEVFCHGGWSSVHRARFLDVMVALLPKGFKERCVSFNHRVVRVETLSKDSAAATYGARLVFADGGFATADAVIGCDGIKSEVRKALLSDNSPAAIPRFTGKYAYRGLIPMDKAVRSIGDRSARNARHRVGYGGHVLTFPIDHGNIVNVVAFRTKADGAWNDDEWVLPASKETMRQDFAGWGTEVQAIVDLMERCDKWALFDHPPAETYHMDGRICLLGDSAHASTPHQGAGAEMAIEDAVMLARLLGDIEKVEDLQNVFTVYDHFRRVRTQQLVDQSREQGRTFDFEGEGLQDDVKKLAEVLPHRWDWIWDNDLEGQILAASEELGQLKVSAAN